MSDEEQWANQKEWENERGELEINFIHGAKANQICGAKKCSADAVKTYEIVESGKKFSNLEISLCEEHDGEELAFELYRHFHDGV